MNDKSYIVFPLRRIAASIYDFFLLIGVWFAVGFISVWINGGPFVGVEKISGRGYSETIVGFIESDLIGPFLVLFSTWVFYGYFWTHGGKTLGMAVWKFEIYSLDNDKIKLGQISIRFFFNLITFFLVGLPLIAMYFSKKNLSLSDRLSRTSYKKI
tara:strand:- start:27 stop:494 length:468 start_codon:yes stop_codon:yes gene_type:complete